LRDYRDEYCIKFELFYFDSNCIYRSVIASGAGLSMRKRLCAGGGVVVGMVWRREKRENG
jgi:hypothetical protein